MAENRNPRWRPSAILDFRKSNFWTLGPLGLSIFHHRTKFGAIMLSTPKLWPKIEIQAILNFRKPYFWVLGPLGLPIFHLGTKFGSKILIDTAIMGQNRNPRWRPSAILYFRKSDFWELEPLGLPIFHLDTKFGAKMLIDAKIMAENRNPKWRPSTYEVCSLGYIGLSNFMLIRCIGLKIWRFSSKFQILSKSVERFSRFGGSKFAISYT